MPIASTTDKRFRALTTTDLYALREFVRDHAKDDKKESLYYWQGLMDRLYIELRSAR